MQPTPSMLRQLRDELDSITRDACSRPVRPAAELTSTFPPASWVAEVPAYVLAAELARELSCARCGE